MITGDNCHHLKVVQKRPGNIIKIGDKNNQEYRAEIEKFTRGGCRVRIKDKNHDIPRPAREVDLYISIPKSDKLEQIVFKCTQVGISRFIPIITDRTVKKINPRNRKKIYVRLEKKIRHGAEISEREKIPDLEEPLKFKTALKRYTENKYGSGIFMLAETNPKFKVSQKDLSNYMALFIGPEGGYTQNEARKAKNYGLKRRSLGSLILDVPTASLVASGQLLIS